MKERTNTASLLLEVGRIIKTRMGHGLPLTYTQCETLRLLEEVDRSTMRTVASHFRITAPSATAIVNELVRLKLVIRAENLKDRREVLLQLTTQGKKKLRDLTAKRKKIVADVLSVLSERDRKALDVILGQIVEAKKT